MATVSITPITPAKIWSEGVNSTTNYERLFDAAGRKIRVRIHVESYVDQSHGYADLFDASSGKWNPIASTSGVLLKATTRSTREDKSAFDRDVAALLVEVSLILSA